MPGGGPHPKDPELFGERWLAALQARRDGVRDLRAWLGGILRNVVRRQLRGDGWVRRGRV